MEFSAPLCEGVLLQRYKRFFADVRLADGKVVTAHCPNTGTMRTAGEPGDTVYLSPSANPKRKLAYTWELTKVKSGYVGINTSLPNLLVAEAILAGAIAELTGYTTLKREVKYGKNSRIDMLLTAADKAPCYVEVKNTTLLHEGKIVFPDAVTTRGQKHLHELSEVVKSGARAVMFYLVNRPEGEAFAAAAHIDPDYATALTAAQAHGVEALAYRVHADLKQMRIGQRVPLHR